MLVYASLTDIIFDTSSYFGFSKLYARTITENDPFPISC
jgi:hypothetical protein